MLPDQCFDRSEVSIRQVLEAPSAVEEGFVGGGEGIDHGHEVIVVVHELEFDSSQMARIAGDGEGGLGLVAVGFNKGLEAEALQSLSDGAAVPTERLGRGLHVEALLP